MKVERPGSQKYQLFFPETDWSIAYCPGRRLPDMMLAALNVLGNPGLEPWNPVIQNKGGEGQKAKTGSTLTFARIMRCLATYPLELMCPFSSSSDLGMARRLAPPSPYTPRKFRYLVNWHQSVNDPLIRSLWRQNRFNQVMSTTCTQQCAMFGVEISMCDDSCRGVGWVLRSWHRFRGGNGIARSVYNGFGSTAADEVPTYILGFERQGRIHQFQVAGAYARQPVQRSIIRAHPKCLEKIGGTGALVPAGTWHRGVVFIVSVPSASIGPLEISKSALSP